MPRKITVAGRSYVPGADHGVSTLLTAAGWLLSRLPNAVVEKQRGALVEALAEAQPLIIEISPPVGVRIWSGPRLLVHLPGRHCRPATSIAP